MPELHVIDHPLVQHKLTLMRKKSRSTSGFRRLLEEISMLMGYEVTRDMPLSTERIETPLAPMDAPILEGKKVVVISILRAGDGILNGILQLIPSARVGHIGLYRDRRRSSRSSTTSRSRATSTTATSSSSTPCSRPATAPSPP